MSILFFFFCMYYFFLYVLLYVSYLYICNVIGANKNKLKKKKNVNSLSLGLIPSGRLKNLKDFDKWAPLSSVVQLGECQPLESSHKRGYCIESQYTIQ